MKNIKPIFIIIIIVLTLGVLVYLLFFRENANEKATSQQSKKVKSTERLKGCDISHWVGEVNWTALKKTDIEFVFMKATEGIAYVDPEFKENWQSAQNFEFQRGAFHFYEPHLDPKQQAEHFLSVVQLQKGDILPVLDIEVSNGVSDEELTKNVGIWIQTVKEKIGRFPIIYTYRIFWDPTIDANFGHCPLWLAEWETTHQPYLPNGWKDWVFWQYTKKGTVAGIPNAKGRVDLDYFNGSLQSLASYTIR